MPELSYSDVRDILALIENSTLDEIHVEFGDFKLDVRRHAAPSASVPAPLAATPPAAASPHAVSDEGFVLAPGQFAIAAPMLGMFYRAPSPDAPPFIEVGKSVAPDDSLCIIEVMKLMNTIKAERPGRVAAILIGNAMMVEFGQMMIVFDPL